MATATYNQTLSSAAARAQGTAVTHYMIRTALTGGSDRRVFFEAFSPNGAALAVGQRYDIPANTLIVTLPTGSDTTADGAEWCLEQIFSKMTCTFRCTLVRRVQGARMRAHGRAMRVSCSTPITGLSLNSSVSS